ncbi:MAG: hypothetical protein IKH32_04110 [Prevotella sp.]|nr:hypothetical protein [Prevotella sp.]
MKTKAIIILGATIAIVIALYFILKPPVPVTDDCIGDDVTTCPSKDRPLNLSIYLDLSDRIDTTQKDKEQQKAKDIAIVDFLANHIKDRAVKQKILPCKDRIKVFFYPAPNDSKISMLAEKLELDLGKTKMQEKKKALNTFADEFKICMEQIYQSTITTSNWQGSDIWGFFNKPIDNYCIKDGYRNVLVVLTDGYIYYAPNSSMQNGHSFNKITNATLKDPDSNLISERTGLDDLEVLMLELNPNPLTYQSKMEKVITDWLKSMGVQRCYVGETDVPANTKMIIENFLETN